LISCSGPMIFKCQLISMLPRPRMPSYEELLNKPFHPKLGNVVRGTSSSAPLPMGWSSITGDNTLPTRLSHNHEMVAQLANNFRLFASRSMVEPSDQVVRLSNLISEPLPPREQSRLLPDACTILEENVKTLTDRTILELLTNIFADFVDHHTDCTTLNNMSVSYMRRSGTIYSPNIDRVIHLERLDDLPIPCFWIDSKHPTVLETASRDIMQRVHRGCPMPWGNLIATSTPSTLRTSDTLLLKVRRCHVIFT